MDSYESVLFMLTVENRKILLLFCMRWDA